MGNKSKYLIILLITFVGLAFLIYNMLYPKVTSKIKYDENEYIIYFYQTDCYYCQEISDDVANYIENGKVVMHKRNIQYLDTKTWQEYGVRGTPTMYYVKNNRIVKKAVGPEECLKLMEKYTK